MWQRSEQNFSFILPDDTVKDDSCCVKRHISDQDTRRWVNPEHTEKRTSHLPCVLVPPRQSEAGVLPVPPAASVTWALIETVSAVASSIPDPLLHSHADGVLADSLAVL